MKEIQGTGKIDAQGEYQQRTLMSPKQLEQGLKQALVEAGYDSREKIIHLVQEVKREIAAERQ
ncbi:hypothetical protein NIES4073_02430 (plasmid) [Kalymmatonema gypsitolerans NIES-4073]|nr:hypothetical protein NIES4073_02430 [Scytonema sp. NIES-4073]